MLRHVNKYIVTDVSKSYAYIITGTHFTILKAEPNDGYLSGLLEVAVSLSGWCQYCCIRCGPGEERILDIVPGGTELGTQVKTESRAGRTHNLNNPQVECTGFLLCVIIE